MITFQSLFSMMRRYKRPLVWGNLIALAATVVSIPIPLLIPLLVDEVREGLIQPLARHRAIARWYGFSLLTAHGRAVLGTLMTKGAA